jgi:Tol biopolymer transport system component/cytosine/adenosine deaminase-related metal-dependent hydrolase
MLKVLLVSLLPAVVFSATAAADEVERTKDEAAGLPLTSARQIAFDVDEATWLSLDVSPDGETLLFDVLGDLYTLPIAGGEARRLSPGLPFDSQPVYSPDGSRIAFVSDRSGAENLWVIDADGSNPRQLSDNREKTEYASPAWMPDGSGVYISRRTEAAGVFEMWLHHIAGGSGVRITKGSEGPDQRRDERWNALGASPSPEGRYLYYARKSGEQWDAETNPVWSIVRRDLETGRSTPVIDGPASALRPQLSPDGRYLAYGARHDQRTGLRLRDLQSGNDRWIVMPVERDGQDGGYSRDTLPRFDFTPDGKAIVCSISGSPHRVELASGRIAAIPFRAHIELDVGPYLVRQQGIETAPVRARIIQAPRQSPDGGRLAFSALGDIYIAELPDSTPRRLTDAWGGGDPGYQPAWSPDGRWLAYVTWDPVDGGHLKRVRADGRGRPETLSRAVAHYSDPVFAPDGESIYALRSSHFDRLRRVEEVSPARISDLIRLPASGGEPALISHLDVGAERPYFTEDGERIFFTTPEGVLSVRTDGSDRRVHFRIEGAYPWNHRHEQAVPVEQVVLSPDGRWGLTRSGDQLHLLRVPPAGIETKSLNLLADPLTPYLRVSDIGADYFAWAEGGKSVTWGLGATFHRRTFDGEGRLGETRRSDMNVELPRDIPEGSLLLRGATAITMRGDEVIDNADILITGNRIAAIGPRGEIAVPADTVTRDVSGRYILPGFIDTHAHWYEVRRDILDAQPWSFLTNLAFGVTSGLDVQAMDQDMFVYQDLLDAGVMVGPRAWSVGRGMFSDNVIDDEESARNLLRRYRDYYRTRNVKSYAIGNRQQRQWIVEASAELGMVPTTEGGGNLKLDMTHAIDGFAGNEHYMLALPLYRDVIELFGRTRIAYTPTLLITSGGPAAEDAFFTEQPWHDHPKLRRFMPHSVIDARTSPRQWLREEQHIYPQIARDARRIMQAGGRVGIGSHAQLQGVAYHWEMQAFARGGWTPFEILRAATVVGSEIIGHADAVGSLEPGKYADLLLLAGNPLDDITHTLSIRQLVKNGRLYDADTLDELWPRQRRLPELWFAADRARAPALPDVQE